ncbi:MAG: ketopantoate reductase family protein [Anaerovoracaceae bacterium]|nr:ketopantoate reductase family protein [Bacillota bacterium]MDY2669988.1 ketopantoate reductase family protein [Anaerovoracaceae bacterium]
MEAKIGITGMGAIGLLFGSQLADKYGKENVIFIADKDRVERYKNEDIKVNGEKREFSFATPDDVPQVDLLIFAVKNYSLEDAIENARWAVSRDTIVVSFLNGVTSEEVIAKQLHPFHLLYSTVQGMDATKEGSSLSYTTTGSVTIGEKNNEKTEALEKAVKILEDAGIKVEVPDDIIHSMWSKWMLNCGVNQACAIAECGYGGVQKGGIARLAMLNAMNEARMVANLEGIDITEEEENKWVDLLETLDPEKEPSMRQDTKAGRPTEVECFAGLVKKLGARHKVGTPMNDNLYTTLTNDHVRSTEY